MKNGLDVQTFLERQLDQKKTTGNRRVIFDTNVWAAIADNDLAQSLVKCSRKNDIELQVAPAVVYETLRFEDETARNKRLKLMTNRAFTRLMPEAFSESLEVLLAIIKYKPSWINSSPDLQRWYFGYQDWTKKVGKGFWWRARNQPNHEADNLKHVEGDMLSRSRADWKAQRKYWKEIGKDRPKFTDFVESTSGGSIEFWKMESYLSLSQGILDKHAYADWILPFVSSPHIFLGSEWEQFWVSNVQTSDVERQFLRSGVKFFQQSHKWSPGTPGDSQLATYWLDTDLFVTGDKSLLRALEQCRTLSPSALPKGKLVKPAAEGARDLIEFLSRS